MNPSHIQWCRNMFASIKDGGTWGIPRSGLIFTRRGEKLVLTTSLPADVANIPITENQLRELQEDDYEATKAHFAAAGIVVEKAKEVTSGATD